MSNSVDVRVPNIGDFKGVEIIEVMVAAGDTVAAEASLITLESDKAAMEIPSPHAGTVTEVKVKVGDKVSEGDLIATMALADGAAAPAVATAATPAAATDEKPEPASPRSAAKGDLHAEVVVLGAGPGGYTAAFRAADLGRKVVLIERHATLGGVCLNVGCIPSKALLHVAQVIDETRGMAKHGVTFGEPKIDIDQLRSFKEGVIGKLTKGLATIAKQRKVQVVRGYGRFTSANTIAVEGEEGTTTVSFDHAIIAAGSSAIELPGFPGDPRIMDSTGALALADVPQRLLVIGGGIIGLEMATVYAALGSRITVVELGDQIIPGADPDLVRPLYRRIAKRYGNIYLKSKVTGIDANEACLVAHFEGGDAPPTQEFDRVLVAVGRRPNGRAIDAEAAGVRVNDSGFIDVDKQQRTNVAHIFAIGDVVGQPMLAHKATHEGKVAAEAAAGMKSAFDARVIPSVAYTDPEVAWVGLTETQAKAQGIDYGKGVFPWAASGRSLSLGRDEGMTKSLFDPATGQLLGAAMVGPNAGELIAEAALAIELGADAEDIGLTIHPHPTLSETFAMAAEAYEGTITDLYIPKKRG
ncbi:dihydrolipoyl dehydrogenase [Endothiovibrio diazotrophicus]